jgi:hypothetical protein
MRWYELRRPGDQPLVYQQGTCAPVDGVNHWMGSTAQDKKGNMALGYTRGPTRPGRPSRCDRGDGQRRA